MKTTKIKYWTIGTSVTSYLNNVIRWIWNNNIVNKMLQNNDFSIVLYNFENRKDIFAKFSCETNGNTLVYENKNHTNFYDPTTLTQFLRVLCYFKILYREPVKNPLKYTFTKEFISVFINNELNRENIHEKFAYFLLNSVNEKFSEYYDELTKNFDELENMYILLLKEGNDNYKITRSLLYHVDEIDNFLDLNEIKRVYNKNIDKTNDNFSFKNVLSTMICNSLKEKHLDDKYLSWRKCTQNIINTICSFYNLPSENSKNILTEMRVVTEKYLEDSEYIKQHYRNKGGMECFLVNIHELIIKFKEQKINIPIFQRDYVWNYELINNLVDSLYEDFKNHNKSSYLNNIIMCGSSGEARWQIIDGQQRIFTLLLILFSLFKITRYYDYKLEHKILELLFSHTENQYKNIYTNLLETNIYGEFSKIIEYPSEKGNQLKTIKRVVRNIIDNLTKKLILEKDEEKNNNSLNISNFIDHILCNTYVSLTILPNSMPGKIFENINKSGKTLDSLDLLRNYIYTMCVNNKLDMNTIGKSYIEKYNKIIEHFFDNNNKVNYKKLENFTLILYKREVKLNNIEFTKSNKSVYMFNLLKKILDTWFKQNSRIDYILDNFLNNIHKYEYITNCSKSSSANYPNAEIPALSSQIWGASLGGNTVFVSIIWKLLDEFNAFNWQDQNITINIELSQLSRWLFEIERFNIFWKMLAFKGQSISIAIDSIVESFFDDKGEWKSNILVFRNKLLEIIPELKILEDEKRNELLSKKLDSFIYNSLALSDPLKFLLLNRINFSLNNISEKNDISNDSLYIKANCFSINNSFKDWHNILEYEHCLAKKDKLSKNMSEEQLNYFTMKINLIGNGAILDPGKNKEIKNKDLFDKIKKYTDISSNNLTIYGKSGFLDGFNDLKVDNMTNELETIYEWIDKRTRQLNELILKIYSY